MDERIRDLLRDRAEDIPAQWEMPPGLQKRARRRIAATFGVTLVAVAALVLGSVVAVRSITSSSPARPANPGPEQRDPVQPSPAVQPTTPTGSFGKIRGWIVYRGASDELIAVDPDDANEPISLGPADLLDPIAWSRDGSRLLLGYGRETEDLYVLNADGSRIRLTYGGIAYSGSFSPDGELIVYSQISGQFLDDDGLYMIDSTGGTPELLVASGQETALADPAWSPDGSLIAFIELSIVGETSRGEPIYRRKLSVVNADGTGRRVVRDLGREDRSSTGWASGLVWSPDGSRFVFSSQPLNAPYGFQVYVVDADGSDLRRITYESVVPNDDPNPVWSPDGSRIAFLCRSQLCIVNADGAGLRVIEAAVPAGGSRLAWNPAG